MDEELSSTITGLRNTFMNKIASPEDVRRTCDQLAEKLAGDLVRTKKRINNKIFSEVSIK